MQRLWRVAGIVGTIGLFAACTRQALASLDEVLTSAVGPAAVTITGFPQVPIADSKLTVANNELVRPAGEKATRYGVNAISAHSSFSLSVRHGAANRLSVVLFNPPGGNGPKELPLFQPGTPGASLPAGPYIEVTDSSNPDAQKMTDAVISIETLDKTSGDVLLFSVTDHSADPNATVKASAPIRFAVGFAYAPTIDLSQCGSDANCSDAQGNVEEVWTCRNCVEVDLVDDKGKTLQVRKDSTHLSSTIPSLAIFPYSQYGQPGGDFNVAPTFHFVVSAQDIFGHTVTAPFFVTYEAVSPGNANYIGCACKAGATATTVVVNGQVHCVCR